MVLWDLPEKSSRTSGVSEATGIADANSNAVLSTAANRSHEHAECQSPVQLA